MNAPEAGSNMEKKCPQCGAALPLGALDGLCPACLLKQGAASETGPQSQAPFVPPTVDEVGALFPQLEVLSLIGRGGMGAVYKARQRALDRVVALKILPPQVAAGPGFAERFNREARALARLNHPNIVILYEFGQVQDSPYFIMEYVDGVNLRQLEHAGRLPPRQALAIIPQICEALQFAHDAGIVHRDVKPENILIDKAGRVRIADFGIAKMVGADPDDTAATGTGQAIGTPHYMAPEQLATPETVDHRADIYALGVVFYEMLTGELPLGKFAPPSKRVQVDVRLDDVVLRALEREPEQRFQKVSEVRTRLATIASDPRRLSQSEAAAFSKATLNRAAPLNIPSCVRRGWALVRQDFWATVLITAIIAILASGATILGGPLWGGLALFYLKKIRGESATIDTAFSGFRIALLPLFLGGLVSGVLIAAGLVCFILPGLYLAVAWSFTSIIIADKGLDFWPAMELSRRVLTRHWFKLFLFWALALVSIGLGVFACVIGAFLVMPVVAAAAAYAYEDLIGSTPAPAVAAPRAEFAPTSAAPARANLWKPFGLALICVFASVLTLALAQARHRASMSQREAIYQRDAALRAEREASSVGATDFVFGRLVERVVNDPDDDVRNACLDLDTGKLVDLPAPWPNPTASDAAFSNAWATLPQSVFQQGLDIVGHATLRAFEIFPGPALPVANDPFDRVTAESVARDGGRLQAPSGDGGERPRRITASDTPASFIFRTHGGNLGILEVTGFTDAPHAVKLRYKLVESRFEPRAALSPEQRRDDLSARIDAVHLIGDPSARNTALARVAADAARAGELEWATSAVNEITEQTQRDAALLQVARLLQQQGLRRNAIAIGSLIRDHNIRDQILGELAR